MFQQSPQIWFVSLSGLSLCPFSELVCDLLPIRLFHGSPKVHCGTRSISIAILTSTAWRTLESLGAFPTLVGGHHSLGATFLGS